MQIKQVKFEWDSTFPIFASKKHLKNTGGLYGWVGGFIDDSLIFVLPYIIKQKLIFKYLQFQSSTLYLDKDATLDLEQQFLDGVVQWLGAENFDFVIQPPTYAVFSTYPFGSVAAPFCSYVLDLSLDEEILWANIHQKHKNVIRRAMKNGVKIEKSKDDVRTAYDLLRQTMTRSGLPFCNFDVFSQWAFNLDENLEIFIATYEGVPQGVAVIPYSNYSAYYLYGGSINNPFLGSLNLLQWEIIKYFKGIGVKKYDFVGARISPEKGSKLEGIQRFKSRFGADMEQGYLWKMPLKPWKYALYNSLVRIKNNTKMVDIIDQENAGE